MSKNFYVSDGSRSHKVCDWYVSVGGQARRVVAAYIGDNQNRAKLFYSPGTVSESNYIIYENKQFYHVPNGFALSNEHHSSWYTTSDVGHEYFSIDNFLDDPNVPVPGNSILWEYKSNASAFNMAIRGNNFEITLGANTDYIVFLPVTRFQPGNLYIRMNSSSSSFMKCMGWSSYNTNPNRPNLVGYTFDDSCTVIKYDGVSCWGIYKAFANMQSSNTIPADYVFFWLKNPRNYTETVKISNIEAYAY